MAKRWQIVAHFLTTRFKPFEIKQLPLAVAWLHGILDLEIGDEVEALLKMRMRGMTNDQVNTLLQAKLKLLPITNIDLLNLIKNPSTDPAEALQLYQIAMGHFGALAASSTDITQMANAISQYATTKMTPAQDQALQALKDTPDATKLEAFALAWDLNGYLKARYGMLYENYLMAVARRQLPADQLKGYGDQLDQLKRFIELPEVAK